MITILYTARMDQLEAYRAAIIPALKENRIEATLVSETDQPQNIDYVVFAPNGHVQDFTPYTNAKLIQSLWAGVEVALKNSSLTQPLARMVEFGLSQGMADYVLGQVLRHHLETDFFSSRTAGQWHEERLPPLSSDRCVGFLGLGALGQYCAEKTRDFGFQTCGWSKRQKEIPGVICKSGPVGLNEILGLADYLVLLLPDTPDTRHIINAETIAKMKNGASIINPGRGPLIDDAALIEALDHKRLSGATLDVFETEPLPKDHPYWSHPKVLVTPHIASGTRISTAALHVVENIKRGERNEPFLALVDREAGY